MQIAKKLAEICKAAGCQLSDDQVILISGAMAVFENQMKPAGVSDYEDAFKDHKRLVRELDVILNGSSAASQVSLCDIVSQVRNMKQQNEAVGYMGSDRTLLPLNTRRKDIAPLFLLPGIDQEPLTHVGNSKFESWYEKYHETALRREKKQVARDAYAAGMGEQARHMKGNG